MKTKYTEKKVVREERGLRFIGFGGLEGKEVTIKKLGRNEMLVIQLGKAPDSAAPHMTVRIANHLAQGAGLLEFVESAFKGSKSISFIATPTLLLDGTRRVDFYQI